MSKPPARGLASLVVLVLVAWPATVASAKPDVDVELRGESHFARQTLTARVQIELESDDTARVRVTNTSPPFLGDPANGPFLTRMGLNLMQGPPRQCLDLEDEEGNDDFMLQGTTMPFCSRVWKSDVLYSYGLRARGPYHDGGIAPGDSRVFRLSVREECRRRYRLTADTFLDASRSWSGGRWGQWAAAFRAAGPWGLDGGCGQGMAKRFAEVLVFTWADFVATSAESVGKPSFEQASDTRAGSVQIAMNGGVGFDATTFFRPFEGAIVTLKNGAGSILEQWMSGGTRLIPSLDESGCKPESEGRQCWLYVPHDLIDGQLFAFVPNRSDGSNEGFDDSGGRVEVRGEIVQDFRDGWPEDSSGRTVRFLWTDPDGLDGDLLELRVRYDVGLDGSFNDDPFVVFLRFGWTGSGPDFLARSLKVLHVSTNALLVELDVQEALEYAKEAYAAGDVVDPDTPYVYEE